MRTKWCAVIVGPAQIWFCADDGNDIKSDIFPVTQGDDAHCVLTRNMEDYIRWGVRSFVVVDTCADPDMPMGLGLVVPARIPEWHSVQAPVIAPAEAWAALLHTAPIRQQPNRSGTYCAYTLTQIVENEQGVSLAYCLVNRQGAVVEDSSVRFETWKWTDPGTASAPEMTGTILNILTKIATDILLEIKTPCAICFTHEMPEFDTLLLQWLNRITNDKRYVTAIYSDAGLLQGALWLAQRALLTDEA